MKLGFGGFLGRLGWDFFLVQCHGAGISPAGRFFSCWEFVVCPMINSLSDEFAKMCWNAYGLNCRSGNVFYLNNWMAMKWRHALIFNIYFHFVFIDVLRWSWLVRCCINSYLSILYSDHGIATVLMLNFKCTILHGQWSVAFNYNWLSTYHPNLFRNCLWDFY